MAGGKRHYANRLSRYPAPVAGEFDRSAYETLLNHGVTIDRAVDHVNQRSIYFADPDGNRLEIYYEMTGALQRFPEGRGDGDFVLPVSRPGEPLPEWLSERWPAAVTASASSR